MFSLLAKLPRAGALIGLLSVLTISASAQIVFTVNATANSTGLAYTSGQAYTFSFTLNDYSPTPPVGAASIDDQYQWSEEGASDPLLISAVSGSGLSGTYTRASNPSTSIIANDSDRANSANRLTLSVFIDEGSNGLTVNGGTNLFGLKFEATYTGLVFEVTNGTPPNPASFFSNHLGTYTATSTDDGVVVDDNVNISFTVNTLTISAVPEPSTYAAIYGLLALGLVVWRKHRQTAA